MSAKTTRPTAAARRILSAAAWASLRIAATSAVIASRVSVIFPSFMSAGYTESSHKRYCLQQPQGREILMTVAEHVELDPVVTTFRARVAVELERSAGSDAVETITTLFAEHRRAAHAMEDGLRDDLRGMAGELRTSHGMLQQMATSAAADLQANARALAAAGRARQAVQAVLDVLDDSAVPQDVRDRAHQASSDILGDQDPTPPARTVVLSLMVDTRYKAGWFSTPDGAHRILPFLGWALTATSGGRSGAPEGAFLLGGRTWPLSELERREMSLSRME